MTNIQRRRMAMMGAEKGLLLWLDGINNTRNGHDATAQRWEDLSGNGNDFTLYRHYASTICTWDTNSFVGTGIRQTSGIMQLDKAILMNITAFTVEVCCALENVSGNTWIFQSRNVNKPANGFQFTGANNRWGASVFAPPGTSNSMSAESRIPFKQLGTVSITYADGILKMFSNGNEAIFAEKSLSDMLSITERPKYVISSAYPWIGGDYPFYGNLYSIKIYDRALTADKLLANHNKYLSRFGGAS